MTTLFGTSYSKRRKKIRTPESSSTTSVLSESKNTAALTISEKSNSAHSIQSARHEEVMDSGHTHSFEGLGLCRPLLEACKAMGFKTPTPVQSRCIPGKAWLSSSLVHVYCDGGRKRTHLLLTNLSIH